MRSLRLTTCLSLLLGLVGLLWSCSTDKTNPINPVRPAAKITALEAPQNLRVEALTDTSARVAWDAVEGATDYDINYKLAQGGKWTNEPHKGTRLYNTIYELEPDTEYRWAIRAENKDEASDWVFGENFTTQPAWFQDVLDVLTDSSTTSEESQQQDTSFDIEIVYTGYVSNTLKLSVQRCVDRWESVITGDLPDKGDIDDLRMEVIQTDTLVQGQYIGWAQPLTVRNTTDNTGLTRLKGGLPYQSRILIASEALEYDIDMLDGLVLHEIGHALGFGTTYAWKKHRKYHLLYGWYLTAPNVLTILEIMQPDQNLIGILLNSDGGHWNDLVIGDELMIAGWWYPKKSPLSKITIAALDDMGYTVDYDQSDPYDSLWGSIAKPVVNNHNHNTNTHLKCKITPLYE